MTGRYGLMDIRRHRAEIDNAKRDSAWVRWVISGCQGELRIRIGNVVHQDGKVGLPRTACGVRWVPETTAPVTFPIGKPVEDPVNCMTCLVRMAEP